MCPAIQGERSTEQECPKVVVFIKVGDTILQLISVKIWLHVGDLDEGLGEMGERESE